MKLDWLILSTLGLVCFSVMSFLITFISRKGFPVPFVLLILSAVVLILYIAQVTISSASRPTITPLIIGVLILTGILSFLGNIFLYQAANDAPNPGLALAIGGMQGGMVAILAFVFLRDKLNLIQIAGIAMAIIAIFLISVGSSQKNSSKDLNTKANTSKNN